MSLFDRALPVTQIIREILSSNTLYLSALQSGIANYAALARKIKPEVENRTGSDVNVGTIVVGLKRLADTLKKQEIRRSHWGRAIDIDKTSHNNIRNNIASSVKLSLIGNIVDVDLKNEVEYDQISTILAEIFGREIEYSLFQTDKQLKLFAENFQGFGNNTWDESRSMRYVRRIKKGLSKITITIPSSEESDGKNLQEIQEGENTFSGLSSILHILYNYHLPLQDAFLTTNKIVLILKDKDAAKTYETLRAKIAGQ